jgi:peroxiredoxin
LNKKHIIYLGLFLLGALGGNEAIKYFKAAKIEAVVENAQTNFNTKAVDFTLPDLDGKQHSFSEWDGKPRVLNFWATWCPPCRKETPMFVDMQEKYGQQGVQFIGVAIDELQKVQDFVDTFGVNYPMLIGADNAVEIAKQYGNRFGALPYTVVINRQGTIVHAQAGEMTRELAEKIIPPLL